MRVLFDTQQWNYFLSSDATPQPEGALEGVLQNLAEGSIEIVGSLDVLQELVEAAPRARRKSEDMVELYLELVGPRLLLPLNERHVSEVRSGGLLCEQARYATRATRREVAKLARSRREVLDLAEVLGDEKSTFRASEIETQHNIRARLDEAGGQPSAALMRQWLRELDIDEWVAELVEEGNRLGHHDVAVSDAGPDRYPSAWTFYAIRLARLVATLGEGRRIARSDLADAHIVSSGPYVDVVVTDDKALRDSLEILDRPLPFQCETSAKFFARPETRPRALDEPVGG